MVQKSISFDWQVYNQRIPHDFRRRIPKSLVSKPIGFATDFEISVHFQAALRICPAALSICFGKNFGSAHHPIHRPIRDLIPARTHLAAMARLN